MTFQTLLELDVRYSNQVRIPDGQRWLKTAAAVLAHSGDSWFWGAALLLIGLAGPRSWRPQIILLFLGIFFTAVTVLTLKFLIKRPRPEGEWGKVYRNSDPHSFPSGHAARMIMLAVIMLLTGYWGLGLIILVWATLVVISRVGLGVHYFSDVVVGGLIGILMGVLAVGVFELIV